MKVGIGYRNEQDAFEFGKNGAIDAVQGENMETPDLTIAFYSGQLDHKEFLRGIQEIVEDRPVIGARQLESLPMTIFHI